jgi:hypothetical protein
MNQLSKTPPVTNVTNLFESKTLEIVNSVNSFDPLLLVTVGDSDLNTVHDNGNLSPTWLVTP